MYSPVRKIENEMGRNRFYVFSKRLGREVRLYNSLQYDHWVLTETDLSVLDYCERPHKITVSVAGKWGDIDWGGFQIFRHLQKSVFPQLRPYRMDKTTFHQHLDWAETFTADYQVKLEQLLENTDNS